MEHGHLQCLATIIYSFSEKQWPINKIYATTEWGIQSPHTEGGSSNFGAHNLPF